MGNVCWAISYYTNKLKEGKAKIDKIQNCIDSGSPGYHLIYEWQIYDNLVVPCIKIVGNIANGNDAQTGYLINLGGIEKLEEQLYRPKKSIQEGKLLGFV